MTAPLACCCRWHHDWADWVLTGETLTLERRQRNWQRACKRCSAIESRALIEPTRLALAQKKARQEGGQEGDG